MYYNEYCKMSEHCNTRQHATKAPTIYRVVPIMYIPTGISVSLQVLLTRTLFIFLLHLRHRGCVMFIPDVSSPLLFSTLRTIQKFIFDPQNFTAHSSAGHTCQAQYYDVTNNVTHRTSNTNGKYFGA